MTEYITSRIIGNLSNFPNYLHKIISIGNKKLYILHVLECIQKWRHFKKKKYAENSVAKFYQTYLKCKRDVASLCWSKLIISKVCSLFCTNHQRNHKVYHPKRLRKPGNHSEKCWQACKITLV